MVHHFMSARRGAVRCRVSQGGTGWARGGAARRGAAGWGLAWRGDLVVFLEGTTGVPRNGVVVTDGSIVFY